MATQATTLPFHISDEADPNLVDRYRAWLGAPSHGGMPNQTGLWLDADGLAITQAGKLALRPDLTTGPNGWRLARAGIKREALARAVGLNKGHRPSVIDATAGLGLDGLVLAQLGCRVTLVERNPAVAALLDDALRRAAATDWLSHAVARTSLVVADGAVYLAALARDQCPQVVYLDPMFALERRRGAAGKSTQLLAELTDEASDGGALLEPALAAASERVVVKRHRRAATLAQATPSYCLEGKSTRFDIHIKS